MSEPLLPSSVNSYVPAANARLARTQDLRNLFSAAQVAKLFGHDSGLNWLSETITQDRTPELRQYLMRELEVAEITPETILSKLNKSFFEEQSDDWIIRLYAFLTELPGLSYRFAFLPLIRLEDGTHVSDAIIGQQSAFLPSDKETGFPTVRRAICADEVALEFLKTLGLTTPDPVDDIVRNVLPKYRAKKANVTQGGSRHEPE